MKYLLIGNSFASLFAAETIRRIDRRGEITIIGDEKQRIYSRALIHEYLAGMVEPSKIFLRDENHYDRLNIELIGGQRATRVLPEKNEVQVDETSYSYDRLFLGLGGKPFVPQGIEGLDRFPGQTFTFLKFEDARRIAAICREKRNVVVLGAGLIGMQAAEALAMLGKKVTVIELADYVLPMVCDSIAAGIVQRTMESEGVEFRLSDSVTELAGENGNLREVRLKSGRRIEADLFVVAVGVRPNVDWVKDSGVTVDRGIVIDDHAQTNIANIYAGGDCAQGQELISGSRMVLATIPIAAEHGTVAGFNMAGMPVTFRGGIPLNALQFGPVQLISYGYVKEQEGQEVLSVLDERGCVYKKLVLKDNRLTGALFVRAIDRVGLFRFLIEEKIDVGAFKHRLIEPDFGPASLPSWLRRQLFGVRQTRVKVPQECAV